MSSQSSHSRFRKFITTLGGITGLVALVALFLTMYQTWQDGESQNKQDIAQATEVAFAQANLDALREIITLQAQLVNPQISSLTATAISQEIARLQSTLEASGISTPQPAEEPSTPTPIPATNTPVPTETPASTNTPVPTKTPAPTNTPVPTKTPIPAPTNTAPGSVLTVGQSWYQDGMEVRLKNPTFFPGCNGFFGFELSITNQTGGAIVVDILGEDITVSDDLGAPYSRTWYKTGPATESCYSSHLERMEIRAMQIGEKIDIAVRVLGDLPGAASQMIVTVRKAGRLEEARWAIDIPR